MHRYELESKQCQRVLREESERLLQRLARTSIDTGANEANRPDFMYVCFFLVFFSPLLTVKRTNCISVVAEMNIQAVKMHVHIPVLCLCHAAERTERWR